MKQVPKMQKWLLSVITGLALAGSTSLCLGATPIVNNFNSSGDIDGWTVNFGTGSVAWDANHGPDASGCLMIVLDGSNPTNSEVGPLWTLPTGIKGPDYIKVDYDIMVDSASGVDTSGGYGNWQQVLRDASWSWVSSGWGPIDSTYNAYQHRSFAVPNDGNTYVYLGFALQGTAPYSGSVTCYVDNIVIDAYQNPYVISTFTNADEVATWTSEERATLSFSTKNAGSDSSGSLQVDVAYDSSNAGWQQGYALHLVPFSPNSYTYLDFDLWIDNPNNLTTFGLCNVFRYEWGGTLGSVSLSSTNVGKWTHYQLPLPTTITNTTGLRFQFGGGMTNTLTYYLDNIRVWKPIVRPTIGGLKKAGPAGVQITMDNNTAQWQREGIATPSGDVNYFWTASTLYGHPATYSFTIADFGAQSAHPGLEAHMYIVNGDTDTSTWDQTYGGVDWNAPDIFMFRVENGTDGGVVARIDWKTNCPGANPPTNDFFHPAYVTGPTMIGTWTLTFSDANHGTISGPGGVSTNFTLLEGVAESSFTPYTSFMQFGVFKNDGANDGHNNQAGGTFSQVRLANGEPPTDVFNDNFSGPTLTSNYAWRPTTSSGGATAVVFVPLDTAWWINWTLPADGYTVESAAVVTGPWGDASVTNTYQSGTTMVGAVPGAALPSTNATFFRMTKPAP